MQSLLIFLNLNFLIIFPSELKLHPNPDQIKKKVFEAKFTGCFSQVSQVNLVNLKLEYRTLVFITLTPSYRKFEKNPSI